MRVLIVEDEPFLAEAIRIDQPGALADPVLAYHRLQHQPGTVPEGPEQVGDGGRWVSPL